VKLKPTRPQWHPGYPTRSPVVNHRIMLPRLLLRACGGLTPPLRVVTRPLVQCGNGVDLFCFNASQDDEPLSC